jgi:FkbM family methyltransferase
MPLEGLKIQMINIKIIELIPPIFERVYKYIVKKIKKNNLRLPPFNYINSEIEARWILDVGANLGDVAESALISYPNSRVICFEPVLDTYSRLKKRLEKYPNRTYLYHGALSDKKGLGEINITNYHGANSIELQAKTHKELNQHVRELTKENINLFKLDDIAKTFPTNKIDILKIDVEGHEIAVLKGGMKFIESCVDTIIIEVSFMRDSKIEDQAIFEIFNILKSLNFILINIVDIHKAKSNFVLLAQIDCVFRNNKFIKNFN